MDPDFSVEPWNKHISESHWNIKESETGDHKEVKPENASLRMQLKNRTDGEADEV